MCLHTVQMPPAISTSYELPCSLQSSTAVNSCLGALQTMQLLLLEFAIFIWKQTPVIGIAAEPVVSYVLCNASLLLSVCLVCSACGCVANSCICELQIHHKWLDYVHKQI